MTKKIDGRTAKGLRIKQQVEQGILTAYIDLIREGIPTPTARETARRAHLSVRVICDVFFWRSLLSGYLRRRSTRLLSELA